MTHPDDDYHRLIGRCEQVAVESYLLRQVLSPAQLAPGSFYVDLSTQILHAWDPGNRDLDKVSVEGSVWNHDERIRHNIIAFNRDAQVWGWFDMKDNRFWVCSLKHVFLPRLSTRFAC